MSDDFPLLLTAAEAARFIGVSKSNFYRMLDDGRLPTSVQHESTYAEGFDARYSRLKLELWAAEVDLEALDLDTIVRHILTARTAVGEATHRAPALPPATGWANRIARTEAAS